MVAAAIEPFLKGDTGRNTRGLLRLIILLTIAGAAVASRLFSVIRKTQWQSFLATISSSGTSIVCHCSLTKEHFRFRKYHPRMSVSIPPTTSRASRDPMAERNTSSLRISRPLVQLSGNKVSGTEWILQFLGLV